MSALTWQPNPADCDALEVSAQATRLERGLDTPSIVEDDDDERGGDGSGTKTTPVASVEAVVCATPNLVVATGNAASMELLAANDSAVRIGGRTASGRGGREAEASGTARRVSERVSE